MTLFHSPPQPPIPCQSWNRGARCACEALNQRLRKNSSTKCCHLSCELSPPSQTANRLATTTSSISSSSCLSAPRPSLPPLQSSRCPSYYPCSPPSSSQLPFPLSLRLSWRRSHRSRSFSCLSCPLERTSWILAFDKRSSVASRPCSPKPDFSVAICKESSIPNTLLYAPI